MMRYLKGILDYGLIYASNGEIRLHGFTYSDWEGSAKDRKRTSGCFFSLGSGMISWFSRKHTSIALSIVEAKYIVACSTCSEEIWIRKMLVGLFDEEIYVTDILFDSQTCIKMIENPLFHDNSKHIEVRYHFIQDMV